MPLVSFDKVLKIILTVLNVLASALRAFNLDVVSDNDETNLDGLS